MLNLFRVCNVAYGDWCRCRYLRFALACVCFSAVGCRVCFFKLIHCLVVDSKNGNWRNSGWNWARETTVPNKPITVIVGCIDTTCSSICGEIHIKLRHEILEGFDFTTTQYKRQTCMFIATLVFWNQIFDYLLANGMSITRHYPMSRLIINDNLPKKNLFLKHSCFHIGLNKVCAVIHIASWWPLKRM